MRGIFLLHAALALFLPTIGFATPIYRRASLVQRDFNVCDNSMLTLAGRYPKLSDMIHGRMVTPTYINITSHMSVARDAGFDALRILYYAIEDVEARIVQAGSSRLGGGQWSFEFNHTYTASALDTGGSQYTQPFRHLTLPVLRDGLKALNDFINVTDLAHDVKGLQFGINSAFLGQVGQGAIG
ncbi:MAG: hypothetical protein Q9222_003954 [Ikaeria aurantiellina]